MRLQVAFTLRIWQMSTRPPAAAFHDETPIAAHRPRTPRRPGLVAIRVIRAGRSRRKP